jgi:hypothetical protein
MRISQRPYNRELIDGLKQFIVEILRSNEVFTHQQIVSRVASCKIEGISKATNGEIQRALRELTYEGQIEGLRSYKKKWDLW